ncbi:DUF2922 family protein [Clostridium bovifaecis]|uniref:DUF2922 family protein n=1 Tax=Clostridium bovifaecis TaxID=2184719 RepID=A0A6I6EP58_9CLOT|nr:DUF2922 family protein [Clostridium bovifaecis]
MSKTLVMNFLTDQGRRASIRFKEVKDTIDDLTIVSVMDTIIEKNIFGTSSGELKVKDSAQIIDTAVQEVTI